MGNNVRIVISSLSADPLLFRLPFGRVAVYIVRQIKTDKYLRLETSTVSDGCRSLLRFLVLLGLILIEPFRFRD